MRRLNGKALVLTGTATLFRATTLKEVVAARQTGDLPGREHVYDVRVLTEDNELTLANLHLGLRVICPEQCTLTTEHLGRGKPGTRAGSSTTRSARQSCVSRWVTMTIAFF